MHNQLEEDLGHWLTGRCCLRRDLYGKPMPEFVKTWLKGIGGNPQVDPYATPTREVQEWLSKTIQDPDWVEPSG